MYISSVVHLKVLANTISLIIYIMLMYREENTIILHGGNKYYNISIENSRNIMIVYYGTAALVHILTDHYHAYHHAKARGKAEKRLF